LSTASKDLSGGEALKPSQLDDELIEDRLNQLQAPPPTSTSCPPDVTHMLPGHPHFFAIFCFRLLLSMQTKDQKTG